MPDPDTAAIDVFAGGPDQPTAATVAGVHEDIDDRSVADAAIASAVAEGDAFADALSRGFAAMESNRLKEFDLPGWEGTLQVRVRKVSKRERDAMRKLTRLKTEEDIQLAYIAQITEDVLLDLGDGVPTEVPDAWRGVAERMGNVELSTSEVIFRCCDQRNPRALGDLFDRIDKWMIARQSDLEGILGE